MKKKWAKFGVIALSSVLAASTVLGLAGCGKGGNDKDLDGGRPVVDGTITNITFWGYGDENEVDVFTELVRQFNEEYKDTIKVKYEPQPSEGYNESITTALQSSRAKVDVLYIPDAGFKRYAANGYLEPLDKYLENSKEVKVEEMWETSINRYKYDVETTTQNGPNAHYWGIPKDIGPTVIFYNETYFNNAGVKVISVAAEDLDKFNAGEPDSRGKTKTEYGIQSKVQEKGYFELDGQKWFNNQVPMSWDECVTLSTLVQEAVRAQTGLNNIYGYYTEWWFNYGWSVGGDCIEYVPTDDPKFNGGYYDFTLMDPTPNYIVKDEYSGTLKINGHDYKAGEIIEWGDKVANPGADNKDKQIRQEVLAAVTAGNLNVLPSQRDAFVEFVRIGQSSDKVVDNGLKGYGICPAPSSIGSDADKTRQFQNGGLAMLVDGRWNVTNFRKVLGEYPGQPTKNGYEWDVAPLPMYKTYYQAGDNNIPAGKSVGDVKVHGIEAGHSGSMALSINANSKKKNAAWLLCEYIGGEIGQAAQSKSGFAIPSQIKLANDNEIFLQTDRNPRNSRAFVRAAEYERAGDWWYLADKLWIDDWAGVLNGSVRNGTKTLTEFEESTEYKGTWAKLLNYTKK